MGNMPLISVIIPSYYSPDLFATLGSVVCQDYPRIQPVLVDDGSRNFDLAQTEAWLLAHNKGNLEQICVLQNPQNRGTVYTMNRALMECRGEYIFNLACDDEFYDETVLSDWVAEFQRTGAQVITAYRAVYDEALLNFLRQEPRRSQVEDLERKSPQELFEDLAEANYVFGSCTARTAESFRKYGAYDENYRLIEDHPAILSLLRQGERIAFFHRAVVKCRIGGTSSAENYNEVYAADVDRILTREVLPHTAHPRRMKRAYFQWKREQRILKKRAALLKKHGKNRINRAVIAIWYYMHHPIRVLCKLIRL